ncbi:MAG: tryptophan--tRNA ligase [Patescibacteria group bacterium]
MRIFSGIQPTSDLHIGNYLGAIKQWVDLQSSNDCVFCIVDWHAITVPYEPKTLQERIKEIAMIYLAAGLDPEKSIIFVQSQIKEHSELAWLLNTITPLGDLTRMTQFKDKGAKNAKNLCAGLLNYPVLMAADILLYQTDIVPVGEDQKQHVELAREIARRFNARFGETFALPKAQIPKQGAKIMSLAEPTKKMSKSDAESSRIGLFDSPEQIKKKIGAATTDSGKDIKYDTEKKSGIANLLTIYSVFSDTPIKEAEKKFANTGYADFKKIVAEQLIISLEPFRAKKKEFKTKANYIDEILENGASKARAISQTTMRLVRNNMGMA